MAITEKEFMGIAFKVEDIDGEFKIAEIERKKIWAKSWYQCISYVNKNLYLDGGLSISSDNTFKANIREFNNEVRFVKFLNNEEA